MAITSNQHTELNSVQISLLRLFNRPMSENETLEIKKLLVDHYSEILNQEVNKAIEDKGYKILTRNRIITRVIVQAIMGS